jgi:hypothetical protein
MSEKIEAFWQDATADDVARVMAGETVQARFRDSDRYDWWTHHLAGWKECSQSKWIDSNASSWVNCQVYREPSWWAKRPDPGPGYTLVGKFPHQNLRPGDERFATNGKWVASTYAKIGAGQAFDVWYRRRIEPVEPVESKPVLIRRRVVEIGDEIKLPNGRVLVFNGEGFEVVQ